MKKISWCLFYGLLGVCLGWCLADIVEEHQAPKPKNEKIIDIPQFDFNNGGMIK